MNREKEKSVQENIVVYETLRNSIISCEERLVNEKIYMFVVYFALLAFSFDRSWLILVSYPVLIVFQTLINGDRQAVEKASIYIRVFFEENGNIHWETLHKEQYHLKAYKKATRNIGWYIEKSGSSILALTSFLALLIISLQQYSLCTLPSDLKIELMVAIFLCIFVFYINRKMYINNGDMEGDLENSIREFYQLCYEQQELNIGRAPAKKENEYD